MSKRTHEITEGLPSVDIRGMVLPHGAIAADVSQGGQTFTVQIVGHRATMGASGHGLFALYAGTDGQFFTLVTPYFVAPARA